MVKDQDFNSIKEHFLKVIKPNYDFLVTMQEKNNEKALEIITMMSIYLQFREMRIKNGI